MKPELTQHARREMQRRDIPLAVVESLPAAPAQKMPEHGDVVSDQSKVEINRRLYLLRVLVNEKTAKVVTVDRTCKLNKYWKT